MIEAFCGTVAVAYEARTNIAAPIMTPAAPAANARVSFAQ